MALAIRCPSCGTEGSIEPFDSYFSARGIHPRSRKPLRECPACGAWIVLRSRLLGFGLRATLLDQTQSEILRRHWEERFGMSSISRQNAVDARMRAVSQSPVDQYLQGVLAACLAAGNAYCQEYDDVAKGDPLREPLRVAWRTEENYIASVEIVAWALAAAWVRRHWPTTFDKTMSIVKLGGIAISSATDDLVEAARRGIGEQSDTTLLATLSRCLWAPVAQGQDPTARLIDMLTAEPFYAAYEAAMTLVDERFPDGPPSDAARPAAVPSSG